MTTRLPCPYLHGEVELTAEREQHIAEKHPDPLPEHQGLIGETLADPDGVYRSRRSGDTRRFARWYDTIRGGKHVVVVVITQGPPPHRRWIVTAYIARRLPTGVVEWTRS